MSEDEKPKQDPKVGALSEYAAKILKEGPVAKSVYVGRWYPAYGEGPKEVVPFLYNSLSEVAAAIERENGKSVGSFLDLGSGDGMVTAIAEATGKFSHCYGVELNTILAEKSRGYIVDMAKRNIVHPDKVTIADGSYYQPQYFTEIKDTWLARHKLNTPNPDPDDLFFAAVNISIVPEKHGDTPTLAEVNERLNQMGGDEDVFGKLGLVSGDGKLGVDCVFWYPSDPFSEESMIQWNNLLRSGTWLVFATPNAQFNYLKEHGLLTDFEHKGEIESDHPIEGVSKLVMFRKK